jgi:hypothetical protein
MGMSSQILAQSTEAAILARVSEADETEITLMLPGISSPCNCPTATAIELTNSRPGPRAGSLTEPEEAEPDSDLHIGRPSESCNHEREGY